MKKNTAGYKMVIAVLAGAMLIMPVTAFARGREQQRGHARHEVVMVNHQRYHYRDGRFYRPGWFWFEFAVITPPIGAVVTFLPVGHRTVLIGSATYYYYDNVYYKSCPSGYVVVPAPVVTSTVIAESSVVQAPEVAGDKVTIYVPNANGSYISVILVKRGNGYIGPQGEYYPGNPTVEQLKTLYGT
ncbi:MAG: DUF6515 family protein [Candidatus Omnitrophica bacterium]|nr:DUF6515 family protein [Candidatus Omnitrophota bacterium]